MPCKDCGSNKQSPMIADELWSKAHGDQHNFVEVEVEGYPDLAELVDTVQAGELCPDCLETRLGRKLQRDDLQNVNFNERIGWL